MRRQLRFSLRASFFAVWVVAAFFAGSRFERERRRRADERELIEYGQIGPTIYLRHPGKSGGYGPIYEIRHRIAPTDD